jgi:hypothetical protein
LRIERAITADSADSGHALVEGGEAAIRTAAPAAAVIGAPRIVLCVCVRSYKAGGHEYPCHQKPIPHTGLPGYQKCTALPHWPI